MKKGKKTKIKAREIIVGKNCVIGNNVKINVRGKFELGDCCVIQDNTTITCEQFTAGEYLFIAKNVEIGRGGCNNPDAVVTIGDHVGIFENTIINPNSPITIGNDVGIGDGVMIWTHGAWLDVTKGFPSDFGPVRIGNNVWLPARCTVLPNVEIGDNVVIGIGSLVNKNIPSGALAAGVPCKVLKEDMYKGELISNDKLEEIVTPILDRWLNVMVIAKNITTVEGVKYNKSSHSINLIQRWGSTMFDLNDMVILGVQDEVSEDLRDHLRRHGIKFYNGELFKSMVRV